MEQLAPVIIFAFNRPASFKATVEALFKCPEASATDLYIFIDGPRVSKQDDVTLVGQSKEIADHISGFANVSTICSVTNQGLGPSIISGVSKVIAKYGKAIVLEDDLIVQPNFLTFMNEGLNRYEMDKNVWSICGYTNKVRPPRDYSYDAYFCTRSSSWGWGTWADRWESVDWSFTHWDEWMGKKRAFNKWGGSDCFSMLQGCKEGRNKSWAIRFCFNQFIQDKLSLFPIKSLVRNDGFDGQGTNCRRYSRFKFELMNESVSTFRFPSASSKFVKSLYRQAMHYNSMPMRIWSRIMYLIK